MILFEGSVGFGVYWWKMHLCFKRILVRHIAAIKSPKLILVRYTAAVMSRSTPGQRSYIKQIHKIIAKAARSSFFTSETGY